MTIPRARRRGAHGRPLLAAFIVVAGAGVLATFAAAAPPFWDEYQRARRVAPRAPDSLLAVAQARLAADPDEFFGSWLAGRVAARARDSTAVRSMAGDDSGTRPGPAVTRALLALERGRRPQAREAFEHAARGYVSKQRSADASRALLFAAVQTFAAADSNAVLATFARAESLARLSGDPAALADVLVERSATLYDDSPGSARGDREEAIRLLEPLGPSMHLATAYRGLGNVHKFAGDLESAERDFRAAYDVAAAVGDALLTSQALGGLGNVQLARAEFDDALASYTRALALARDAGQPRTTLARHGDLATLCLQLGHVSEARAQLDAADRLVGPARAEVPDRVALLGSRASLEALVGQFDPARTALDSAVALATRAGATLSVPTLRLRQAEIASDLGEDDAAERFAEMGLAAARAVGHRRAEIMLGTFRAEQLLAAGRSREALAAARALAVACAQSFPRQLGAAARVEAAALADLGRSRAAIAHLRLEVARATAAGDSTSAARSLAFAAELHARRGEPREAGRLAVRAYELWRASGDTASAFTAAAVAGEAALIAGRPRETIRWLRPALAHEDRVSSRMRSSDDRAGHRSGWYERAVLLAAAYAAEGAPERALEVLEQTRARELWRLLSRRSAGLRTHVDAELAADVEAAETELAALQALRLRMASARARPGRELARLDARIDSVKTRHAGLMQAIQRAAPLYSAAASTRSSLTPERMRAALQQDEQVHWFMVGPRRTVHWRMDRAGLRARVIPLGEAWWARRVAGLVGGLQSGADRAAVVAGLGDTLLGPWEAHAAVARVHVVPDGPLHDLPFDALDVTVPGRGRTLLLELAEVDAAPSAALLFLDPTRRALAGDATGVVAFGDPELAGSTATPAARTRGGAYPAATRLAHTRREVEAIREAFPRAHVFVGPDATESAFFDQAARSTILHVAAHGFVDDRRPAYSGLALAPGRGASARGDDGLVQAFEVAEASIGAELATLSACESGAGTLRRGEGLQGLARAFQIAGVRHLLVSLWQVEDVETADLMAAFYRRLAAGAAPAAALREAKRESLARQGAAGGAMRGVGTRRRSTGRAASATWAAFVLLGPRADR